MKRMPVVMTALATVMSPVDPRLSLIGWETPSRIISLSFVAPPVMKSFLEGF
jgi:hypothetical protein